MATAVSIEQAPEWAIARAANFQSKLMDENALKPYKELSPEQQDRQRGIWLAYTFTLDDPKRAYIYGAVVNTVANHANGQQFYALADLGAGNGRNTIKTAMMLHDRDSSARNIVYLVEQSGTALEEAKQHFEKNGFFALTLQDKEDGSQTSIQLLQKDITSTGLPSQSVDGVTSVNVWHHLPDWDVLMASAQEIHRILRPGGLFVIVDTRPLPASGLNRHMIESSIKRVVNSKKFLVRANREGAPLNEDEIAGVVDFCEHDALKAFENALTKEQFEEVLRRSSLAPSLQEMRDLRSTHPILRLIYPPLNFAWGLKAS